MVVYQLSTFSKIKNKWLTYSDISDLMTGKPSQHLHNGGKETCRVLCSNIQWNRVRNKIVLTLHQMLLSLCIFHKPTILLCLLTLLIHPSQGRARLYPSLYLYPSQYLTRPSLLLLSRPTYLVVVERVSSDSHRVMSETPMPLLSPQYM